MRLPLGFFQREPAGRTFQLDQVRGSGAACRCAPEKDTGREPDRLEARGRRPREERSSQVTRALAVLSAVRADRLLDRGRYARATRGSPGHAAWTTRVRQPVCNRSIAARSGDGTGLSRKGDARQRSFRAAVNLHCAWRCAMPQGIRSTRKRAVSIRITTAPHWPSAFRSCFERETAARREQSSLARGAAVRRS